ncbi:hypothetical protein BABINDRAFT_167469 [Babjeviella inositovora NRRL Y-12698]|uniref:Ribosomal protein S8 n=1 Tax=Babjeviella inositovora NRRL Y-12698 TaxID=984486 RepID=A0A1E3QPJ3_9ASCO|nr:uncharacterized protein BABINDRAFT_167469 [Babjeviella inositovora NRRL Y-12698]ODQ79629.1 hypothetical protein BABINDRAFT_167469 [Babjeviella inositovora NRRL Y-12698]
MSLVALGHVCAHLQNVTRVNLGLTSVPLTKLHLELAANLYQEGFISSIQRGDIQGPDAIPVEITPDNVSTRRLWLGLKYRNGHSVIKNMHLVSKPSRRMNLDEEEIKALAMGRQVRIISPLQPAEAMFVRDNRTKKLVELRTAARKNMSGEVLCRVSAQ